jgi:hypothetical protein
MESDRRMPPGVSCRFRVERQFQFGTRREIPCSVYRQKMRIPGVSSASPIPGPDFLHSIPVKPPTPCLAGTCNRGIEPPLLQSALLACVSSAKALAVSCDQRLYTSFIAHEQFR